MEVPLILASRPVPSMSGYEINVIEHLILPSNVSMVFAPIMSSNVKIYFSCIDRLFIVQKNKILARQ